MSRQPLKNYLMDRLPRSRQDSEFLKPVLNKDSLPRWLIFTQEASLLDLKSSVRLPMFLGIQALFGFSFDGDAAVDPNIMVLWFSQTILGLEAKVVL